MNFEQMIQRLIDGLNIIRNRTGGAIEIAAHSYTIMVPGVDYEDFKDDEKDLSDLGWRWSDDMGWVLPVIG